MLCACMLGLSMGEAGVSIMHDVNHGAGLHDRRARYALGMGMDLVRMPLLLRLSLCCPGPFQMQCQGLFHHSGRAEIFTGR